MDSVFRDDDATRRQRRAAAIIIIIPAQSAGGEVIDSKDTVMLDSFICGCFNGCTTTTIMVGATRRRSQDDEFEHHVRLSQVSATTWGSFYHSLRQLFSGLGHMNNSATSCRSF